MRKNVLFLLAAVLLLSCGGDKYAMIRKAVEAVNKTTPARTWNGERLESVQVVEKDNLVEFHIQNVRGSLPDDDNISDDLVVKEGEWYIANIMTAYDHFVNEKNGEGDEEMFMEVGPLLIMTAGNEMGVRFRLDYKNGGTYSYDLSPKDVAEAVKLRKDTFYKKYKD